MRCVRRIPAQLVFDGLIRFAFLVQPAAHRGRRHVRFVGQPLEIRHLTGQALAQAPPHSCVEAAAILVFQQDAFGCRAQKLLDRSLVLNHRKIEVARLEGDEGIRPVEAQIRAIHQPIFGAVRRFGIAEFGAQYRDTPSHQPAGHPIEQQ
jgi:hypothetical protein